MKFAWSCACRLALLPCLLATPPAFAHGSVVAEDDLCIVNIGYLKAHFKIFVPQVSRHREYCEDIPVRGATIFVMEYEHDGLSTVPLDFRIVRNTTGKGTFARLGDIEALPDLDAVTVRYEPPSVVPGVYTVLHEFANDGEYIGIVRALANGKEFTAVFPFVVGRAGIGIWPWFLAGMVLLQLNFWYWTRRQRPATAPAAVLVAMLMLVPVPPADAGEAASADGALRIEFTPSIDPLVINRMHSWEILLVDGDGAPVSGAEIEIEGGMPAHDHGLPTRPQSVPLADPGHYRIDGIRFHMPGAWELVFTVAAGDRRARIVVALVL